MLISHPLMELLVTLISLSVPCRLSSRPQGLIDVVSLEQAGGGTSPARGGDDP